MNVQSAVRLNSITNRFSSKESLRRIWAYTRLIAISGSMMPIRNNSALVDYYRNMQCKASAFVAYYRTCKTMIDSPVVNRYFEMNLSLVLNSFLY
jgi:hypothetical protein